jgi:hypothetical protein
MRIMAGRTTRECRALQENSLILPGMLAGQTGGVLRFPFQRRKHDPHEEFAFLLRRFTPRTVFMDVGATGCDLALEAASYVERVYAVDVSGQLLRSVLVPCNVRLVLCDGVRIPVPEASVDVAFSGGFIDRLRPGAVRVPWAISSLVPENRLRIAGYR